MEAEQAAQQQQVVAAEEQAGMPSENAAETGLGTPPQPQPSVGQPVEPPAPVADPVQEIAAAEEQAGLPSEEAVSIDAPTPIVPDPSEAAIDPKFTDALEKIKQAQEELARAQQQAMAANAAATAPTPSPIMQPAHAPVTEPEQESHRIDTGIELNPVPTPSPTAPTQEEPVQPIQPAVTTTPITPVSPAIRTAAPAMQGSPVGTGLPPAYGLQSQKPVKKSSSNKTMIMVFGILALIIAGVAGFMYVKQTKQKEINDHITELGKLGGTLVAKATELGENGIPKYKYDSKEYGIDIKPNREDAEFLIQAVRDNTKKIGWEAQLHLLSIMATLDPSIADMVFDDIKAKPTRYSKPKLQMLTTLLSVQENPKIMAKLALLTKSLGEKKNHAQQATIMAEMRYGMAPSELPEVVPYLVDSEVDASVFSSAAAMTEHLLPKASDRQKQAVADKIISSLKNIAPRNRSTILSILAQTGTPQALNHFKSEITNDEQASEAPIQALGFWPDDSIYPVLIDMVNSGTITNDRVKYKLNQAALYQVAYDRERTDEQGRSMLKPYVEAAEKEESDQKKQEEKLKIISVLRNLRPHGYVTEQLEIYAKDGNEKVAMEAGSALNRIKEREEQRNKPKEKPGERKDAIDDIMKDMVAPNE